MLPLLPINLSGTINVQPCLVFLDLTSENASLSSHLPYCRKKSCSLWNLTAVDKRVDPAVELCLDLAQHCFFELLFVRLPHCFM